jgi:hypothetical protein
MTDRAQFEAMLEALINEDQESAKEIFHNIVVSKSREIYEELLAEDFTEEQDATSGRAGEEPMGEMFGDEEDDSEEPADDAEDDSEEGDDEEGEENPFGDEEGSDSDMDDAEQTDRTLDLEDALEELKAEFEQLMSGDEAEGGMDDMGGMDAMGGDDMGDMGDEEELEGQLFEYVNKVSVPKGGDNGVNTKSLIDNMKNDMGGTNKNIAQSFSTEKGGTQGGLLKPTTSVEDFGNVNKPGANAGKTAFKKKEPGHGAEKAGSRETADNKQSLLRQAKK